MREFPTPLGPVDQEEIARSPFSAFVGNRVREWEAGRARLSLLVTESHLDAWGRLHPGVLATMMDAAVGAAMGRLLEAEKAGRGRRATVAMDVFLRDTARVGEELTVEGEITERQGAMAFARAEVRAGDGRLLAWGHFVFAL